MKSLNFDAFFSEIRLNILSSFASQVNVSRFKDVIFVKGNQEKNTEENQFPNWTTISTKHRGVVIKSVHIQ